MAQVEAAILGLSGQGVPSLSRDERNPGISEPTRWVGERPRDLVPER